MWSRWTRHSLYEEYRLLLQILGEKRGRERGEGGGDRGERGERGEREGGQGDREVTHMYK